MPTIVIAAIALGLTVLQYCASLLRWVREPTFEVVDARMAIDGEGDAAALGQGSIHILATGGARSRKIVRWALGVIMDRTKGTLHPMNPTVATAVIPVAAREPTVFGLDIISGPRLEGRNEFTAVLGLDMGYGYQRIEFNMQVSGGEAILDLLPQQTAAWHSLRVKPSLASAIRRRVRLLLP